MFDCPRYKETDGACALTGCNNCPLRLQQVELLTQPIRRTYTDIVLVLSILALGALAVAGFTLPERVHEVNVAEDVQ